MDQQTTDPQAHWEPLEPDDVGGEWGPWQHDPDPEARHRCTSAELEERVVEAVRLLQDGYGSALSSRILAERYRVTPRQARNYLRKAADRIYVPLTRAELMTAAQENLDSLQMVVGEATRAGDQQTVIRANAALSAAVSRYLKAFTAADTMGPQRLRLRTAKTPPEVIG